MRDTRASVTVTSAHIIVSVRRACVPCAQKPLEQKQTKPASPASQPLLPSPIAFGDRPRECELRPLRPLIALLISGTRESTPPNPASSEVDLLRSAIRRYVHEIVHDRLFTRARDTQKMATIIIHQRCCPMKRDCAHVQKEAITAAPLALLPWPTK